MIRERAPAKVNLILQVGPPRADGLHPLCSLFASLDLADDVWVEPAGGGADEVLCPGVEGPNLAAAALAAYRARAPAGLPPLRVQIHKRIPVAGGLGGGSADAAAVLRVAQELSASPLEAGELNELARGLGSDVPSQLAPAHALVTGTGETVEPVELRALALVLVPQAAGLSTADVYREADRIGATRARLEPERLRRLAAGAVEELAGALENDLEAAALSLRPELAAVQAALRAAGALAARITGSGPTVFGLFASPGDAAQAQQRLPGAVLARAAGR